MAASSVFPYLRSCKIETTQPISGTTTGEIPEWIKGTLIRIGSGLLEIGPDRYNHVFDGMALMHSFRFETGNVTYRNRFLRSDAYRKNMEANRIVVSEFSTMGATDPCKTIFQKFSSLFKVDDFSDNDLVNVIRYSDELYACSETSFIWRIDPNDLQSIEKVNLMDFVNVNTATAHAHEDRDGTVYNIGSSFGWNGSYNIIQFPPKKNKSDSAFQRGSVICKIPFAHALSPSYFHSFGITENYIVFVEQPLYLSVSRLLWAKMAGTAYSDALYWDSKELTRFHVIRRSDNTLLSTKYLSEAFFVFHHINAYEDEQHVVVDMCCFQNGDVIKCLYVKALEELHQKQGETNSVLESSARRYVLPILNEEDKKNAESNLVKMSGSRAKSSIRPDGSIFCEPEILTGADPWYPELPRIHYEKFNGKKYRYFYAMARNSNSDETHLIKVDIEMQSTISWKEQDIIPSEPVFIPDPNTENQNEDSGVVVASLLYTNDEHKVSILVLDAQDMQEIGRTSFQTEASVPGDFHGTFVRNV